MCVYEGEGSPVTKLADEACDLFKGMPTTDQARAQDDTLTRRNKREVLGRRNCI